MPAKVTADDRALLATETLSECAEVQAVIALGLAGRGKSTLISVLLGGQFEVVNGRLQVVHAPVALPATSHQVVDAHTVHINVFRNENMSNYTLLDLAGLAENRGKVLTRWTRGTLRALFAIAESFDAVLICMDGSELPGVGRCTTLVTLAKEVATVFKGASKEEMVAIARAFVFVVKEPKRRMGRNGYQQPQDLIDGAERHKNELVTKIADLKNKLSGGGGGMVSMSMHMLGQHLPTSRSTRSTRSSSTADDQAMLADSEAELFLTEAFIDAVYTNRFVYSLPFDTAGCKTLANDTFAAIRRSTPISSAQLRALKEHRDRVDETLSFSAQLLAPACEELLPTLIDINMDQRRLRDAIEQHKGSLSAIDQGQWQAVKQQKREHQQIALQALKDKRVAKERRLDKLKTNTKLETLHDEPINEEKTSGLFSWVWLGGGWAEKHYSYSTQSTFGTAVPFVECRITKEHAEVKGLDEKKEAGTVSFDLESERGHNLDERVTISTRANEHPNTKARIATLSAEVRQIGVNERAALATLQALENCHDGHSLAAHLVTEASQLQKSIKAKLQSMLHTPYAQHEDETFHQKLSPCFPFKPSQFTPEHTRVGLARLVNLFGEYQLHSEQMTPSARACIKQFQAENSDFEKLQSHPLLQSLFPTQVDDPSKPCLWHGKVPASKPGCLQALRQHTTAALDQFLQRTSLFEHGAGLFVIGGVLVCLLAVAMMTGSPLPWPWVLLALTSQFIGTVLVVRVVGRTIANTTQNMLDEWKKERAALQGLVAQVSTDLGNLSRTTSGQVQRALDSAVTKLTDSVKVDVQHRSRVNVEMDRLIDRVELTGIRASLLGDIDSKVMSALGWRKQHD